MANNIPNIPHEIYGPRMLNSLSFNKIDCYEVEKLIDGMNSKKCVIETDVPARFSKIGCKVIATILLELFNSCLKYGIYPDSLKVAQVIPDYKEGAIEIRSNYIPISLLSQINKMFEKIIYRRLYSFLKKLKF